MSLRSVSWSFALVVVFAGAARADDTPAPMPPDLAGAPEEDAQVREAERMLIPVPLRDDDLAVDHTAIADPAVQNGAPVAVTVHAAAPRPPMAWTASAFAAGYGYSGHPSRTGGVESQVRGDLWQGLEWGVHAAYTIDVIDADDEMTGNRSATSFHDLDLGGSLDLGLFPTVTTWAFAEVHLLGGSTSYGSGIAGYAGAGARYRMIEAELGIGGVWSSGDSGLSTTLRVGDRHVLPWLGAALLAIYTNDGPTDMTAGTGDGKLAGGAELTFGPWRKLTVMTDAVFGDRSFAMMSRGQIVENVPDVEHTTLRAFVWYALSSRIRGYVGGSLRTATAPVAHDYTMASGFAGAVVNF